MHWTRPLGGLVALGVALGVVGALSILLTETVADPKSAAGIVLVALLLVVGVAVGARGRAWLSGTYW